VVVLFLEISIPTGIITFQIVMKWVLSGVSPVFSLHVLAAPYSRGIFELLESTHRFFCLTLSRFLFVPFLAFCPVALFLLSASRFLFCLSFFRFCLSLFVMFPCPNTSASPIVRPWVTKL